MSRAARRRGRLVPFVAALGLVAALGFVAGVATAGDGGRVYDDAESVEPLAVGASVPSAQVRSIDGASVDLASLTAEQGALLVFYRGGW